MKMDFSYEYSVSSAQVSELKLIGYLDETSTLPTEEDFSKVEKLFIDFSQLDFINSGGIKTWIIFIDKLEQINSLKVYFRKCPQTVVDQINLVHGFLPKNGQVISVFVPVFCNKCERCFNVFQDMKNLDTDFEQLPERVDNPHCGEFPGCKSEFEIDVVKEHYFRFLKQQNG